MFDPEVFRKWLEEQIRSAHETDSWDENEDNYFIGQEDAFKQVLEHFDELTKEEKMNEKTGIEKSRQAGRVATLALLLAACHREGVLSLEEPKEFLSSQRDSARQYLGKDFDDSAFEEGMEDESNTQGKILDRKMAILKEAPGGH